MWFPLHPSIAAFGASAKANGYIRRRRNTALASPFQLELSRLTLSRDAAHHTSCSDGAPSTRGSRASSYSDLLLCFLLLFFFFQPKGLQDSCGEFEKFIGTNLTLADLVTAEQRDEEPRTRRCCSLIKPTSLRYVWTNFLLY